MRRWAAAKARLLGVDPATVTPQDVLDMLDAQQGSFADWIGEKPPEEPGPKLTPHMPWKEL